MLTPHQQPVGYTEDKQAVLNRLRRVEGQIRGITRQVEDDTYCIDVLTQIAAANKALHAVGIKLLKEHLSHCVIHAANGHDNNTTNQKIDEATAAIERLLRS